MIRLDAVSKSYGLLKVLDGVDFAVDENETIAILGPNGSGKTTLLKLIAGILPPDSGTVEVAGRRPREVRSTIGYAGHEPHLYPHLTVEENLEFFARMYAVDPSRASSAIERTGLGSRRRALVGTLSRGETQRASLARATIHDPVLLIADEPLSGLDDSAADHLHDMLGIGSRTVIVATHDLTRGRWGEARRVHLVSGRVQQATP